MSVLLNANIETACRRSSHWRSRWRVVALIEGVGGLRGLGAVAVSAKFQGDVLKSAFSQRFLKLITVSPQEIRRFLAFGGDLGENLIVPDDEAENDAPKLRGIEAHFHAIAGHA